MTFAFSSIAFERSIYDERLQQKYNDLIKQGLYITSPESKMEYEQRNRFVVLKYAFQSYNNIADSSIKVGDDDLKALYDRNINKYKQEASRNIDYVIFDVQPSQVDKSETLQGLTKLTDEFHATTNDSAYVAANSDEPYDNSFHKKGAIDPRIDTVLQSATIGTVIGPIESPGSFRLAKLVDIKTMPDSVQAKHILLKLDGKKKEDDNVLNAKKLRAMNAEQFLALSDNQILDYLDEKRFPEKYTTKSLKADVKAGKISIISPVARALIGKKTGDLIQVKSPKTDKEYEVLKFYFE